MVRIYSRTRCSEEKSTSAGANKRLTREGTAVVLCQGNRSRQIPIISVWIVRQRSRVSALCPLYPQKQTLDDAVTSRSTVSVDRRGSLANPCHNVVSRWSAAGGSAPFWTAASVSSNCWGVAMQPGWCLSPDGRAQIAHDTRALQAYLGHKNIQHTVRYTELSPTRFKDFWRG